MNKMSGAFAVAAFVASFCVFPYPSQANELEQMAENKQPIKVFLGSFSNESGQAEVVPDVFKEDLKKAFKNRKSVHFEIAATPAESDVQVSGIIKKFQYLKNDPVKPAISVVLVAVDAVIIENFVEMDVEFTVLDTRTGNTAWKDKVTSFVKRMMTPAESIPLIYDKVARRFLSQSFGNKK